MVSPWIFQISVPFFHALRVSPCRKPRFCMTFTARQREQVKGNCYAQTAQIRKIRRKMTEIMTQDVDDVASIENKKRKH